ncbi:MAG TPA: hypothetical protein PLN33_13845 [Hyphomonadaceae bacterium]|jgi:hypothetical protein|nr:hypothetical protein [Hyphomonadaceae bacterium]HPN04834.1 hypothetical protein [Hyphomonadaceae bacterium]
MKALGLAFAFTCLAAPAFAEPTACVGAGYQVAKKAFVENLNASNAALTSRDYGGALMLAVAARPHTSNAQQAVAVTQLEVAAHVGLDDRAAASSLMKQAIADVCLPSEVRMSYVAMLAKWGGPLN